MIDIFIILFASFGAFAFSADECSNTNKIEIYGEFHSSDEAEILRNKLAAEVSKDEKSILLFEGTPSIYNDNIDKLKTTYETFTYDKAVLESLYGNLFGGENTYYQGTAVVGTLAVFFNNLLHDETFSMGRGFYGIPFFEIFVGLLQYPETQDFFLDEANFEDPYSKYAKGLRAGGWLEKLEYFSQFFLKVEREEMELFSEFLAQVYANSISRIDVGPSLPGFKELPNVGVTAEEFFNTAHPAREGSMMTILKNFYCGSPNLKIKGIYGNAHLDGLRTLIQKDPILSGKPIHFFKMKPPED